MQFYKTLIQRLVEENRRSDAVPEDLRLLIEIIANACKKISYQVGKTISNSTSVYLNTKNIHGEHQKKIDAISNEIMLKANKWSGNVCGMVSEEMEKIYWIPETYPKGRYLLLFDPIDGSSNIDINVSIGTIFSVLRSPEDINPTVKSFLQSGSKQIIAGYAIYGPQTMLVLSIGNGVDGFTLNREIGEWILTHSNLRIPRDTMEFSINTSNIRHWYPPIKHYVNELLAGIDGPRKKDFNMRWVGSMVADVHRILCRGGVFIYPADKRPSFQCGKLRLMYEANPMGLLIEKAGGKASDGNQGILDIQPKSIHERIPVFIGSANEVERIMQYHVEQKYT